MALDMASQAGLLAVPGWRDELQGEVALTEVGGAVLVGDRNLVAPILLRMPTTASVAPECGWH